MAIKSLVKVWKDNKIIQDEIDFLKKPTKNVNFPISDHIIGIIKDLIDTFKAVPCAGIAANQIGYNKKVFIGMKYEIDKSLQQDPSKNIDDVVSDPNNYEIYINPQIDKYDKQSTQIGQEGCLSIPSITLELERYNDIKVRYYDMNGKKIKKPLSGFLSRLFQHELDHLDGNLMIEHKNIVDAKIWFDDDIYQNLSTQLIKYLKK